MFIEWMMNYNENNLPSLFFLLGTNQDLLREQKPLHYTFKDLKVESLSVETHADNQGDLVKAL